MPADDTPVSDAGAGESQWIDTVGTITVRVRNEEGEPLQADIDAREPDGTHPSGFDYFARLDELPGGYAAFFEPGEYTVEVTSDGYRSQTYGPVKVGRGDHDTVADVRLARRTR